ncbi:MAG: class B sortase [Clostridiales bacterium]|nr:class B sortase [Clostridiales bacterium]
MNKETGADGKKPADKKSKILFSVCLVVLIVVIVVAVGYACKRFRKSQRDEDLTQSVTVDVSAEDDEEQENDPEDEPDVVIPVDFEALQEVNPDIYAWIHIEDTNIDYPILQSEADDDYYLDHTVDGDEGLPGSIYTQYSYNSGCFEDNVTVIYGHNMRDDSYFGQLSEYQDEDFRSSHSVIEIYTPEHIYTYRLVFAITYDNSHLLAGYDCNEPDQYEDLLNVLQKNRTIPTWIEDPFTVTTDDKLIILSTCNGNSSQRYLVGAVLEQIDVEDAGLGESSADEQTES